MKTFWNTYKSSILLLAAMVAGGVIGFLGTWSKCAQPIGRYIFKSAVLLCCTADLLFFNSGDRKNAGSCKTQKDLNDLPDSVLLSPVLLHACLW